jgi:diguanylate cyclase (GGDEF)-like protein
MGGDEFTLLLVRCPLNVAQRLAEDVRTAFTAMVLTWNGQPLQVGASLGVAALSVMTESVAEWLQEADTACYGAKAAGCGVVRMAAGPTLRVVSNGVPTE